MKKSNQEKSSMYLTMTICLAFQHVKSIVNYSPKNIEKLEMVFDARKEKSIHPLILRPIDLL